MLKVIPKNRTKIYRYIFFLFWIVSAIIFVLRIGFDLKTYFAGSTIPFHVFVSDDYEYLLHLPPGYTDFDNPRPLIVFLHGSGETNKGLKVLSQCDLWHYAKGKIPSQEFPFIVVSPITPQYGWNPQRTAQFIKQIIQDETKRYRIAPDQVYLTGFSMGAFGTFDTACSQPDIFAAIVPVAGAGNPENADRLNDVPAWAFHGELDDAISCEFSSKMIEAMKEANCEEAKITILRGAGHGIAGDVYSKPELYRWMLLHKKLKNKSTD